MKPIRDKVENYIRFGQWLYLGWVRALWVHPIALTWGGPGTQPA